MRLWIIHTSRRKSDKIDGITKISNWGPACKEGTSEEVPFLHKTLYRASNTLVYMLTKFHSDRGIFRIRTKENMEVGRTEVATPQVPLHSDHLLPERERPSGQGIWVAEQWPWNTSHCTIHLFPPTLFFVNITPLIEKCQIIFVMYSYVSVLIYKLGRSWYVYRYIISEVMSIFIEYVYNFLCNLRKMIESKFYLLHFYRCLVHFRYHLFYNKWSV